jgi:hypothetical protein
MVTKEEIEGFLERLTFGGGSYKEVESGTWVVRPGGSLDFDLVVHYSPPVVLLRVKVIDLPGDPGSVSRLSRRLLEMNASDMIHGSYGIEQDTVVVTEALELSHLDFEEFLAAYEGIALALASHLREIGSFNARGSRANNGGTARRKDRGGRGKGVVKAVAKAVSRVKNKAVRRARKRGGR